ncbi:MAG: hypothetical protein HY243_04735 [Proteobacteria bacterium]|nr:hypothetical protein [Pseudomonadota bacterium]
MKIRLLTFRWAWTTMGALAAFAVLAWLDLRLKAHTGYGTVDLQKVATAQGFDAIVNRWLAHDDAATAGFSLGFDYLFMPLYGFAFYYSGLIVRDWIGAKAGLIRRVLTLVAAVPLAGAVADAVENALETKMLIAGADDRTAQIAFLATNAKSSCFFVGLALLVLTLPSFLAKRRKPAGP